MKETTVFIENAVMLKHFKLTSVLSGKLREQYLYPNKSMTVHARSD